LEPKEPVSSKSNVITPPKEDEEEEDLVQASQEVVCHFI
jgi:hypothetical protein